ncbi:MAG: addiction module protein [Kiritimatiellaeota bacterium]|nr:addiction module protein [Kiritimatiellota bacterium]
MKIQELVSEAISLPVTERAFIASTLLKSLNPPEPDIDAKWAEIAKNRLDEIKTGHAKTISGEEVFQRVWKRFSE